jgi:hypothetical protein
MKKLRFVKTVHLDCRTRINAGAEVDQDGVCIASVFDGKNWATELIEVPADKLESCLRVKHCVECEETKAAAGSEDKAAPVVETAAKKPPKNGAKKKNGEQSAEADPLEASLEAAAGSEDKAAPVVETAAKK